MSLKDKPDGSPKPISSSSKKGPLHRATLEKFQAIRTEQIQLLSKHYNLPLKYVPRKFEVFKTFVVFRDIAEVPENISENESTADDVQGPMINEETPPPDAGIIVSAAVQGLYQWIAKNENQLTLDKGDIVKVSRKYVIFYLH